MDLRALSEFGLISRVRDKVKCRSGGVIAGIGDDCAVLVKSNETLELFTADLLIEDVHFRRHWSDPFRLGKKALSINLSDIAAMGGRANFYLVLLACPSSTPVGFVDEFYAGMEAVAAAHGLSLVGGDTSAANCLMIGVAVLGEVNREEIVYRSGAKPGDKIYATGTLGDAAAGLKVLEKAMAGATFPVSFAQIERKVREEFPPAALALVEKQLSPVPRVEEGRKLAEARIVSAMIDLSDGLLADLGHLCQESKVGACVSLEKVPFSKELQALGPDFVRPEEALAGGEDYELLFTVPPGQEEKLFTLGLRNFFHRIGEITAEVGQVRLLDAQGKEVSLPSSGYDHFAGEKV